MDIFLLTWVDTFLLAWVGGGQDARTIEET